MIQAAVQLYHMRGWILIPLNGKVPPKGFRLKEMFEKNIQEPEEVARYFPPNYQGNVGIVTGKASGLIVVDLDSPSDARWAMKHFGNTPFVVQTGKQGFQAARRK